jgi:NAD(P)-dependent dehydrogenase (short-subunit alcohol dehydrogenase family)
MSKVVLVTGGSSGIGKTICLHLQSKGYTVYGTSRNPNNIAKVLPFKLIALDVTQQESANNAIATIVDAEGRIDVLVNNAGVGITGPIEETPNEEITKAFNTNLYGPINVMKAALPQMRLQKSGLIINVTSIAGYMGLPYRGIYSATKGALELVTEAMRMEVKDFNVQITNVAPGDFATNIAAGRYHTPVFEESAYKTPYGKTLKMIDEDVDSAGDPIAVAHTVYKIINTRKPKIHYKVGAFMQKFSIVLKHILPDKVYEKLLINHYKL